MSSTLMKIGAVLDYHLNMKAQISSVSRALYYKIYSIVQIKKPFQRLSINTNLFSRQLQRPWHSDSAVSFLSVIQ